MGTVFTTAHGYRGHYNPLVALVPLPTGTLGTTTNSRGDVRNRFLRDPSQKLPMVTKLTETNFFFIEMSILGGYRSFCAFLSFLHWNCCEQRFLDFSQLLLGL